ncbi:MAG TPA: hypothetical protein VGK19_21150 [Capsulimonadaceae bacterium]|jgi:hypothetical protein
MDIFQDPSLMLAPAGAIKTRHARDIAASPLCIGFETLDRRMFNPDKCYDLLAESGAKWARCQTGWSRCEIEKGVIDFAWLDEIVDQLLKRGVQPWFNLGFGNKLYMPGVPHESAVGCVPIAYGPECLAAWKRFVAAVATHFAGRVKHWEIWNEPNIDQFWHPTHATGEAYAELIAETAPIIKRIQPDSVILGCTSAIDCAFIHRALKAGMGDHIDAFSLHPYTAPPIPEASYFADIAAVRALMAQYAPHVRLWQGECGYPARAYGHHDSWMGIYHADEASQAKFVLRRIVLDSMARMDVIAYFHISDLMEQPYRQSNGQERPPVMLGLLNGLTYTPKMSYDAFKHIAPIFDANLAAADLYCRLNTGVDTRREGALPFLAPVVGTFIRDGYPLFAYYFPEDLQRGWRGLSDVSVSFIQQTEKRLEHPVLVDCLAGKIYRATSFNEADSGICTVSGLPLTDYPLLLTDDAAVG